MQFVPGAPAIDHGDGTKRGSGQMGCYRLQAAAEGRKKTEGKTGKNEGADLGSAARHTHTRLATTLGPPLGLVTNANLATLDTQGG